MSPGTHAAVGT